VNEHHEHPHHRPPDAYATVRDLRELQRNIMSAISTYAEAVGVQFDAISTSVDEIVTSQTGISGDVAGLKALILQLQNSPGAITPEDQALLDALTAKITTLSAKTAAVSTALKDLDAQTAAVVPAPAA